MSITRRVLTLGAAALLVLTVAAPTVAQEPDVTPARVAGENRHDTAAEIATLQYDETDEAVVARGDAFPDALTAAPLAAAADGPVLLTEQDALPAETRDTLTSLDVEQVTLLGGEQAISEDVADTIRDEVGVEVVRLGGTTRYGTASDVARAIDARNDHHANFPGGQRAAFLAYANAFPDALATGSLAASTERPIPILLSDHDELPPSTEDVIDDLDLDLVIIAGGPQAISEQVADTIDAKPDVSASRVFGQTRQGTATALADFGRRFLDFDVEQFELTRGDLFADALAIGPYAGEQHNPILLSESPDELGDTTGDYLEAVCPDVDAVQAVGGEVALATSTLQAAESAAESCEGGTEDPGQDLAIAPMEPVEEDAGATFEFSLVQVDGDEPPADFTADVTVFPCDAIDEPNDGTFRFEDTNDDGLADGIASSDHEAVVLSTVNGDDVPDDTYLRDVVVEDDTIDVGATADTGDCANVVYFVDENNDSGLAVDSAGAAEEPWGFSRITFSSS